MRLASVAFFAGLTLGGCAQAVREGPASPQSGQAAAPETASAECGAGKLGSYLNLLPTSETMDSIHATIGHQRIRVIAPGDAVTMDFRPDRLNMETGEDGRIKRFRCG